MAKALIPLVPTTLLLVAYTGWSPLEWLVWIPEGKEWAGFEGVLPVVRAILIGTALALAVDARAAPQRVRQFFEAAGVAYGTIIALTISAQCFGAGLKELGVSEHLLGLVRGEPWALALLSFGFPWSLALLSGSGSGPILTFGEAFLKGVEGRDDPVTLAALGCLAGACGRTMSPVAAVVLYCSGLVGVSPIRVIRPVLPALLAGALTAVVVVLAGVRLP